jgi:N-acylneuraminate cytidylyltransferase
MRFLGVIPARGGSKGVPNKNIRLLAGKPLIFWTIQAARESSTLARLIISTDSESIAAVAHELGVEVRIRPSALAADDSPTRPAIELVAQQLEAEGDFFDAVVTLQPTSPLRLPVHIQEACALFSADPHADSLVSCVAVPHIFNPVSVMKRNAHGYLEGFMDAALVTRRQEKPEAFARNGAAIYITRRPKLAEYIFGGNLVCYLMDERHSIDIDTADDFATAERLMAGQC